MDAAAELALINAALTALYTGGHSSYSIGARTVTRLDIKGLTERKKELEWQIARESGGGAIRLAKITRPSA